MVKLFYKDKPIIGLDISQTGIKVMAVDPKKWLVLGYGSVDLDPAKVQKSLDGEDSYLTENITSLIKEKLVGSLPSNHVVLGIPTSRTFSRTFTVPASAEKNLADAVEVEVDQYIPIPINSLYVDYEVISRTKENITVIMSAVPKLLVDNCNIALAGAGLQPILIEPSINSVARVLEATEEGHLTTLIIDIGPASTDIAVLDGGAIRVTGGLGIGGNTFTLDIAKKMNVALENAHQLKVLNGLSAGPRQAKITAALQPNLQRILSEVRKVMRYYNERLNDDHKIEQVLIVGGGSNVPGIGDYFTNELVMPARVASPWQKLDFGSLPQPSKQFRPRYITVAGLASIDKKDIWK
jgi:type IV pilus assembly protein PilM